MHFSVLLLEFIFMSTDLCAVVHVVLFQEFGVVSGLLYLYLNEVTDISYRSG